MITRIWFVSLFPPITIGKHIDLRYLFSVNILYFFNIAIFFKKAMNVNQNSSTESCMTIFIICTIASGVYSHMTHTPTLSL